MTSTHARSRRRAAPVWIAALALFARAAGAQEAALEPGAVAFVEAASEHGQGFAGAPIAVRVRFGFEQGFLENALVQPFRRPLDVPAQLEAPWLQTGPEAANEGLEVAVNDGVATVERKEAIQRGGRTFAVFELERTVRADAPGALVLEAPVLRFAYATAFDDDLLRGRVARDRRDAEVRGEALEIPVLPLPEQGRPDGFTGAIGRFELRASARPTALAAGETLALELAIEGDGDLDAFPAPALPADSGLHELGRLERREPGRRVVTYELVPRDATVAEVPALRLVAFDPTPPGAWRVVASEPIPLDVRAGAGAGAAEPGEPAAGGAGASPGLALALAAGLLALVLIALAARNVLRR